MARSQLIAAGVVAILRFGFGSALLVLSKPYPSMIGSIANMIAFAAFCFYMMKIKLCPEVQNHLLLTVIEASVGIMILEFMLALWGSVECIVASMVQAAFADLADDFQVIMIADMIIMAMAICLFLTVLIEGNVLQQAMEFYRAKMSGNKRCPMPSQPYKTPVKQQMLKNTCTPMPKAQFPDPNCPLHGDSSPQNCRY